MSNHSSQQNGVVQSYIDGATAECKQKLKELLQSTSVEDRFRLLRNERGVKYVSWSMLHEAALIGDVENMICMLNGFTAHQTFEVLKGQNTSGSTALHIAAYRGHDKLLKNLLDRLTSQQLLNILKLQNYRGNTLLHEAANGNHFSTFRLILTSVSPDHHSKLLNMKNRNDQFALNLATPELNQSYAAYSAQVITEKTRELSEQEKKLEELVDRLAELERHGIKQDQVIAENARILQEQALTLQQLQRHNEVQDRATVENTKMLSIQQQQLSERCEDLETYNKEQDGVIQRTTYQLEELDREMRRPIFTDETGDQEVEDY